MRISREEVLRVAELANLSLSEAEATKFQSQLDTILTYIDKLEELNVSEIEPMAQVLGPGATPGAALRDDVACMSDVSKAVLEQAPEAKAPYFRVPKVIER